MKHLNQKIILKQPKYTIVKGLNIDLQYKLDPDKPSYAGYTEGVKTVL